MTKVTLLLLGVVVAYVSAQCSKITYVTTAGNACSTTNQCVQELTCAPSSNTCKHPALAGDACSVDDDCKNSAYNLYCSSSKCTIRFKNSGASCTAGTECSSGTCTNGACATQSVGSSCTSGFCGSASNSLSCSNQTCIATAAAGATCGGSPFVQCIPGYYCVGTGSTGTCQAAATTSGSNCAASSVLSGIWANPGCSLSNNLVCTANKCASPGANIALGQPCGTTDTIGRSCNSNEGFCNNQVCTAYSSVSCQSNINCGGGVCNCADVTRNGTCASDPYSVTGCASQLARYIECGQTVNNQNPLNTCGDKYKAYRCCLRNLNLVPNKDLTLAYCSSATIAQASVVVMAVVAMIALLF